MPTEDIYTLKPSGGDYTSFVSAFAALSVSDWITLDQIPVVEFYQGTYDGVNMLDERPVANFTNTDATHPLIVRPATGEWGDGTSGSGLRVEDMFSYNGIFKVAKYVKIYGLEIVNTSSTGRGLTETADGDVDEFRGVGMLIDANQTGNEIWHSTATFIGCRFTGAAKGSNYAALHYNCLAEGCTTGFMSIQYASLYSEWVNCVAYNNTAAYDQESEATPGSSNNASSQYSTRGVPGSAGYLADVVSGDFTDAAGGDFSLSGSSNLADIGADLSATFGADWLDITGTAFDSANPPIGCYQPSASSTPFTGTGSAGDVNVTGYTGSLTVGLADAGVADDVSVTGYTGSLTAGVADTPFTGVGSASTVEATGAVGEVTVGFANVPDFRPNAFAFMMRFKLKVGEVATGYSASGVADNLELNPQIGELTLGADLAGDSLDVTVGGGIGSIVAGLGGDFVVEGNAGLLETISAAGAVAYGASLTGQSASLTVLGWSGNAHTGATLAGQPSQLSIAGYAGSLISGNDAVLVGQASALSVTGASGDLHVGNSLRGTVGALDVLPRTGSIVTTEATVSHDITGSFDGYGQSAPVLVSETALNVSVWSAGGNTLVLERSFDDGTNWRTVSDITDDLEQAYVEPEEDILYRVRVTNYVGGTISYRLGLPRARVFCCGGSGTYFVADVGNMMN